MKQQYEAEMRRMRQDYDARLRRLEARLKAAEAKPGREAQARREFASRFDAFASSKQRKLVKDTFV